MHLFINLNVSIRPVNIHDRNICCSCNPQTIFHYDATTPKITQSSTLNKSSSWIYFSITNVILI